MKGCLCSRFLFVTVRPSVYVSSFLLHGGEFVRNDMAVLMGADLEARTLL